MERERSSRHWPRIETTVIVTHDGSPGAFQGERLTRLMRRACSDLGADWVMPLDADEMIVARSRSSLRAGLRPHATPMLIPWRTHLPTPADDAGERNPVARLRHRLAEEAQPTTKVVVPRHIAARAELDQGSHDLLGMGDLRPWRTLPGVVLAHFPVRTAAQFAAKVAIGTFQYLARGERHDWGYHYIEPFEILMRGWDEFEAALSE